jgi:hypothetical protein
MLKARFPQNLRAITLGDVRLSPVSGAVVEGGTVPAENHPRSFAREPPPQSRARTLCRPKVPSSHFARRLGIMTAWFSPLAGSILGWGATDIRLGATANRNQVTS